MNTATCTNCGKTIQPQSASNHLGGEWHWYAAVGETKDAFVCWQSGMKWAAHQAEVSA